MGAQTNIEWADATWNPFGGCSVLSPGCTNCYAMKLAGTRLAHLPLYAGTTTPSKAGPVFNGALTAAEFGSDVWTWPLRWKGAKQPKGGGARSRIFVGDMADIAHPDRPWVVLDRVFAVAALCPQHDFLILTKRPDLLHEYLAFPNTRGRIYDTCAAIPGAGRSIGTGKWPLANVWVGTSAEDQARWNERRRHLLEIDAAVRFVSAEPLLGPIDFSDAIARDRFYMMRCEHCGWIGSTEHADLSQNMDDADVVCGGCTRISLADEVRGVDWIIVGGESGRDARPMHPSWARQIRNDCKRAKVAFFFKQWGEWGGADCTARGPGIITIDGVKMRRVGKAAAGRMLDGVLHDARPR